MFDAKQAEIGDVFFSKGRVLVTCTIEIEDVFLGVIPVQGYGTTKREALDDAHAALHDLLEQPDSLVDANEPPDSDNDLEYVSIAI